MIPPLSGREEASCEAQWQGYAFIIVQINRFFYECINRGHYYCQPAIQLCKGEQNGRRGEMSFRHSQADQGKKVD